MFLLSYKKNIDTFWLKKAPYQELCKLNVFHPSDAEDVFSPVINFSESWEINQGFKKFRILTKCTKFIDKWTFYLSKTRASET